MKAKEKLYVNPGTNDVLGAVDQHQVRREVGRGLSECDPGPTQLDPIYHGAGYQRHQPQPVGPKEHGAH